MVVKIHIQNYISFRVNEKNQGTRKSIRKERKTEKEIDEKKDKDGNY